MNPAIARIKEAAPLPVVAGEYVKLRKMGTSLLGLCPFHQEKTPSLRVHAEFFKCFGCGAAGDVITFIGKIEGVSPGRAIALLSERTGIPLDSTQPRRTRLQKAYDAQEQAFAEWWHHWQCEKLARRVSVLNEYYAALDDAETDDVFWRAAEAAGVLSRQVKGLDRSQVRALAERCSTQDDRAEWSWLESLPRLLAGCPLHGLETLEVTHGASA